MFAYHELVSLRNHILFMRQNRKDIDLNLKPFRGNNNINKYIFHTKKNVQFETSNKYVLLLLLLYTCNTCMHTYKSWSYRVVMHCAMPKI